MTTAKKLWLGFGTLTALLVLSGLAIFVRVRSIEGLVHEQANVARPRSAATRQLEINLLDYALGVHEYLDNGDPKVKEAADQDAGAVQRHLLEYEQLATTDQQRTMATDFAALWQKLYDLGQTLMSAANRQPNQKELTRFHDLRTELEKFLDEQMQPEAFASYDARKAATLHDARAYALVCRTNQPLRLTQAELEAHPAWKAFGKHTAVHPPLRGWLAVPFTGLRQGNVGLIQLSDKYEGEFTADDEAVLVQLAQMASVAIDNSRLIEDLQDADRRKDEFLATLAHELRNPLAPVRNAVQILHLHGPAEPELQWVKEVIDRQIQQMTRLIDDLMDVSRISRDKLELRKERVELATVVRGAVETSRPLIDDYGHELTVMLPPEPILLDADVTRLAQVFLNLLNNAAKYTEKGGRIDLSAERQGSDVVVSVRDSGIGIPVNKLRSVFEMFAQVEGALSRSQGGLGIGLCLVKRLVEMHGGSIEAHSDGPGKGSTFVVRLPVVLEPRREPKTGDDNEELTPTSQLRILVVDDNQDAASSLAMLLKIMGNHVRTAYDGAEAVRAAGEFHPQVVLLDIGLPKMNGYDAARHIRQQPGGKNMVLIAVTGWGQEEDRRKSEEAGFDQHLVKPVDPQAVMKLLASLTTAMA